MATRRIFALTLALALSYPKGSPPLLLPSPPLITVGYHPIFNLSRPLVHRLPLARQCPRPTLRIRKAGVTPVAYPTATLTPTPTRTVNATLSSSTPSNNASTSAGFTKLRFGVVLSDSTIDDFENRLLFVQQAIHGLLPSSTMKMVLGEVGKGLGSGRLRALLGGKGVSTFGKKVGGGLVMKFGSPWSMKLAGRLWSRYKRDIHRFKVIPAGSTILIVAVIALLRVFGIDIDTAESALGWALFGAQQVLPILPHGKFMAVVVSEMAKVVGRGRLKDLVAGVGRSDAFARVGWGVGAKLPMAYGPKVFVALWTTVVRGFRHLSRPVQFAACLLLVSTTYLAASRLPPLPAIFELASNFSPPKTIQLLSSHVGRPPPPTPPPPLPG